MAYSEKQKESINEIIDNYTRHILDRYVCNAAKEKAKESMEAGKTNIEVADDVYDYINQFHSGNLYMAIACKQVYPRSILLILRNDIINALK